MRFGIPQVFSDKSELRRQRVELRLTRRLRAAVEHCAHRVQGVRHSRERGTQPGVRLGQIGRRGYSGKMDGALAHALCCFRHDPSRDRHAIVRDCVMDHGELEPRGHLERGGIGGIHIIMNGGPVAGVGVTASRDCRENRDKRNGPVEGLQVRVSPRANITASQLHDAAVTYRGV